MFANLTMMKLKTIGQWLSASLLLLFIACNGNEKKGTAETTETVKLLLGKNGDTFTLEKQLLLNKK